MEGKTSRLLALEGLRGLAALVVVFYHCVLIFYPAVFFGSNYYVENIHSVHFEDNLVGSPFLGFLSGTFSVAIFFIISGFVLTIGFFQTADQTIIKKLAAKRYLRLMLPALASILFIWLLLALGLDSFKNQAQEITHSLWLESNWNNLIPNLAGAIGEGVGGIVKGSTSMYYNTVLWTLSYELVGSILVFAVALLFRKVKYRWIIYLALLFATYSTWYAGFIIGMIIADLYTTKQFPFSKIKHTGLMVGGLVIGLFLGGYPSSLVDVKTTVYKTLAIGWLNGLENQIFFLTIGAALVLVAVLTIRPLTKVFESNVMRTLGKYSFSLYLMHTAVIFTVCVGAFVWLVPMLGYNKSAVLAILIAIPFVAVVTFFFEKYIDKPSVRVSGIFANWLLGIPQKVIIADDPQIGFVAPPNRFFSIVQKTFTRLKGK